MTCLLKGFCTVLAKQLHDIGVEATAISSECQDAFPCEAVLENSRLLFQHVDQGNAAVISAFVRQLFPDTPVTPTDTTADFLLHQQPFYCQELDIQIYQPCSVKSCAFWTANSWTRNCILDYRVNHVKDLLDVKDLAFLMGLGLPGARQKVNDAIAAARYWALKNRLSAVADAEAAGIAEPEEIVVSTELSAESVLEEAIHVRFGIGAARVLRIAAQAFASVKSAAQAIDIPPDRFLTLCMQHGIVVTHLI